MQEQTERVEENVGEDLERREKNRAGQKSREVRNKRERLSYLGPVIVTWSLSSGEC